MTNIPNSNHQTNHKVQFSIAKQFNKLIIGHWFLFGLIGYWLLVIPQTVHAQSALGISAIPPRLEVEINPGEVKTFQIKVRNESSVDRPLTTEIKDFVVIDDSGTPIQIENTDINEEDNRWAAASWIQVSPAKFIIKAGETKSLSLTVLAPEDALPGGHYAMVLHSPETEAIIDGTGSIIQPRVGTLVYVTIPGNIKQDAVVREFSAPNFLEFGPVNFKTSVTNLSDIHISPTGNIIVTNWFGGNTATIPLEDTNIFPYVSRDIYTTLNKKWLFGRYKAQLIAGYGTTGGALAATLFFWVIPWRLIVVILAAIALIIALTVILKKSKKTPPSSPQLEPHPQE